MYLAKEEEQSKCDLLGKSRGLLLSPPGGGQQSLQLFSEQHGNQMGDLQFRKDQS